MPIYTFTCQQCGAQSEELLKISDLAKVDGPEPLKCRASSVVRTRLDAVSNFDPDNPHNSDATTFTTPCGGVLKRAEIETAALTPYSWRP